MPDLFKLGNPLNLSALQVAFFEENKITKQSVFEIENVLNNGSKKLIARRKFSTPDWKRNNRENRVLTLSLTCLSRDMFAFGL